MNELMNSKASNISHKYDVSDHSRIHHDVPNARHLVGMGDSK